MNKTPIFRNLCLSYVLVLVLTHPASATTRSSSSIEIKTLEQESFFHKPAASDFSSSLSERAPIIVSQVTNSTSKASTTTQAKPVAKTVSTATSSSDSSSSSTSSTKSGTTPKALDASS